jgi:hypothetical protein
VLRFGEQLELSPFLPPPPETAAETIVTGEAYELFAILIHSGSAAGGHYHSYVKDMLACGEEERWCDYNDAQVLPLRIEELQAMMGGTATAQPPAPTASDSVGANPTEAEVAETAETAETEEARVRRERKEAWGASANAYMLVYRRERGGVSGSVSQPTRRTRAHSITMHTPPCKIYVTHDVRVKDLSHEHRV